MLFRSQLEDSEKRYNDLFHLSPLPMWVYDIETLRFLDVNRAAEAHYGYTLQEFLNMTISDIRPKEDIPAMMKRVEDLNKMGPIHSQGTYRHKKKNGDIIYVEIQSNTIPFQGTTGRIILANDITERFTYIEAIEKQNEKLKEIASDKIVISMDYSESRGKLALGGSESDLIFFDAGSLSKAKSFNLGQNSVKTVCFGENILMAGTTDNALIMNNIYGSSPISISTILKLLILALFIYYLKTKA